MDGICEIVRPRLDDVALKIGDDVYLLSMLTLDDWAQITAEVRKMRPDPIQVALRMIAGIENREDRVVILERAWSEARRSQIVPEAEVMYWVANQPEGAAMMLWLSLRHRHPDLSPDVVRSWFRPQARDFYALTVENVAPLLDRVHGLPPTNPT